MFDASVTYASKLWHEHAHVTIFSDLKHICSFCCSVYLNQKGSLLQTRIVYIEFAKIEYEVCEYLHSLQLNTWMVCYFQHLPYCNWVGSNMDLDMQERHVPRDIRTNITWNLRLNVTVKEKTEARCASVWSWIILTPIQQRLWLAYHSTQAPLDCAALTGIDQALSCQPIAHTAIVYLHEVDKLLIGISNGNLLKEITLAEVAPSMSHL